MDTPPRVGTPVFLLIEDDPADVRVLCRALGQVSWSPEVHIENSVEAALEYLSSLEPTDPWPSLAIVDLQLPGLSGHHLLEAASAGHLREHLPVLVLSTSSTTEDVRRSYDLGAVAHVGKPHHLQDWTGLIDAICVIWARFAEAPTPLGVRT